MFSAILENDKGQQLPLTGEYVVTEIDGLGPSEADINMTQIGLRDGSIYNSSRVNSKTITITMAIDYNAEANRLNMYKYARVGKSARLYYSNDSLDVYIDGYIKSVDVNMFSSKQIVQIVLMCEDAYFSDVNSYSDELTSVSSEFTFPFTSEGDDIIFGTVSEDIEGTLINTGDVDCGMTITLTATADVTTPGVYNTNTAELMSFDMTLNSGEQLVINTGLNKSIKLVNDSITNAAGYLIQGSEWLKVYPGTNTYSVTNSNLECVISFTPLYQGV